MYNMASRRIIVLLCFVLLLLHQGYSVPSDPLNIAYNKATAQSSEYTPHPAWLAVDGNTDGTKLPSSNRDGEFSHTNTDPNQWWKVDLGQIYYVYRVKLWSRVDQLDRLSHISILSSTDVNPPTPSLSSESWISLSYREEHYEAIGEEIFYDPVAARHLAVFNNGTGGVTLVEFQAFGVPTSTEHNIAELKKTHGTTSCISAASLVDGNLTTVSHSCDDDETAQWEVDLGVDYNVTTIRLHCADCGTLPMNGFQVKKDSGVSTNCAQHSTPQTDSTYFDIRCNEIETARLIILESATNEMKLITEVQIFGSRSLNYALQVKGAVAEQSSNYSSNIYPANHAIDGLLGTFSHTTERSNEWLKINLMQYLYVTDLVIYNRQGCCQDRTRNTTFYTTTEISSNGGPAVPDWSVCLYRAEEITIMDHIRCDNDTQPLAVQVALQVGYDHGVAVAEFEVYGLAPGDFDDTPRVTVMSTNSTNLVMVIHQWLNNMTGDVPPTSYIVYQKSSQLNSSYTNVSTVLHDTSTDTVEVVIDNLSGSEGYDYKILAQHGDIIMKDLADVNVSLNIPSVPTELDSTDIEINQTEVDDGASVTALIIWQAAQGTSADTLYKVVLEGADIYNETIRYPNTMISVTNLTPYADYTLEINTENLRGSALTTKNFSTIATAPNPPGSPAVSSTTDYSCLKINWSMPAEIDTHPIDKFSYTCDGQRYIDVSNESNSDESCGYPPDQAITCYLRAVSVGNRSSDEVTAGVTLPCAEPIVNLTRSDFTPVVVADETSFNLTVTWQVESRCSDLVYNYSINSALASYSKAEYNITDTSVTLDKLQACQNYNFTLNALNNKGLRANNPTTWTTPTIVPKKPEPVTILEINSTCVNVSWAKPADNGCPIHNYTYTCTSDIDDDIGSTTPDLFDEVCGFSPGSNVTCIVYASNDEGSSENVTSSNIRLSCQEPTAVLALDVTEKVETRESDMWERITLNISWNASEAKCFGVVDYLVTLTDEYNSSVIRDTNTTELSMKFGNLDPYRRYTFNITSINDEDRQSSIYTKDHTTQAIAPYDSPGGFNVTARNANCVGMSWAPPQYPNGVIDNYTFTCVGGDNSVDGSSDSSPSFLCGFYPGSKVTCTIRADNSDGSSPNISDSTMLPCISPGTPQVNDPQETVVDIQGVRRIKLNYTWAPVETNCYNNVTYYLTLTDVSNNTIVRVETTQDNSGIFAKLDPFRNYSLLLVAGNDAGINSTDNVAKVYETQELAPYDGPKEFGVVDQTHECVNLTWIEPEYPNGIITDYSFTCSNASDIVSNSSSTLQGLLCGFYPGSNLTCNISAHNSAGYSPNSTTEGRLDCTTPETPVIDGPPSQSVISVDNRDRIQLTYTWPPVETNCYNNVTYYLTLTDVSNNTIVRVETTQDISASFTNLDPFRNYSLLLVAGNDAGIYSSDNNAKVYETQELAPYDGPTDFSVVDQTHECVYLTWIEPEYPNGIITDYNFTCSNGSDIVSNSSSTLQGSLCGFYPGSNLTCNISAHNSAGYSPTITTEGRLDCTTPETPVIDSPPSESVISVDNRDRIHLTYTWPEVDRQCHGNVTYKVTLRKTRDGTVIYTNTTQEETITFIDLDAVTEYSLVVVAVNSEGFNSTSHAVTYTTQELAPYDGPGTLGLSVQNDTCIKLNWTEPTQLNGDITNYTYSCNSTLTGKSRSEITPELNGVLCDFNPGYIVSCYVSANTSYGEGPQTERNITLPCIEPDQAVVQLVNETEHVVGDRDRIMIEFTWEAVNSQCHGKVNYTAIINLTDSNAEVERLEIQDNTTVTFMNLNANTNYSIRVIATNFADLSSVSNWTEHHTKDLAPYDGPRDFNITKQDNRNINLTWKTPAYPNSAKINDYTYHCTQVERNGTIHETNTTENLQAIVGPFEPGYELICNIFAANDEGNSPNSTMKFFLPCIVPSTPEIGNSTEYIKETIHYVYEKERIELQFKWLESEPNCYGQVNYSIQFSEEGSNGLITNTTANSSIFTADNLDAYTRYTFVVTAINEGQGRSSSTSVTYRTKELAPYDEPQGFNYTSHDSSCVYLEWGEPLQPNGIIANYSGNCEQPSDTDHSYNFTKDSSTYNWTQCGFNSSAKIVCTLSALNSAGSGPSASQNVIVFTKDIFLGDEPLPEFPGGDVTTGDGLYPIKLPAASEFKFGNSEIQLISAIVVVEKVLPANDTEKRSRARRRAIPSKYDAGEIMKNELTSGKTFYLGNGNTQENITNYKLEDGEEYTITLDYKAMYEDGVTRRRKLEGFSQSFSVKIVPEDKDTPKDDNTAAIAGGVGGTLSVIIVVIVIVLVVRHRSRRGSAGFLKKKADSEIGLHEIASPTPITSNGASKNSNSKPDVPPKPGSKPESTTRKYSPTYSNLNRPGTAMSVHEFNAFVETGESQMLKDYEEIGKEDTPKQHTAANSGQSSGKNRYIGIYPEDEFRVKLDMSQSVDGTDYINASYLKGYKKDKKFIAAQGPNPKTIVDFWQMIWEQRPCGIVMVTKCVESGKPKCEQYWSDTIDKVRTFGDVSIRLDMIDKWADYTKRSIRIIKGDESRVIQQYHYLSWPDHGVPDDTAGFVSFCDKIRDNTRHLDGPLLVHCSAGVGRTGTYIALDNLREEAKHTQSVDLYECVRQMRLRRPKMVQTKEQYVFLHKVLLEAFETEDFTCKPPDMQPKLAHHDNNARGKGDIIAQEHQRIEKHIKNLVLNTKAGKLTLNRHKNRDPEILPHEAYRPYIPGSDSDYINAVLFNSYRQKSQLVATQLPLESTIEDFWQLIWEKKCYTIAQLQATDVPFYPTKAAEKESEPEAESKFKVNNKTVIICRKVTETSECVTYQLEINKTVAGSARSKVINVVSIADQELDAVAILPKTSHILSLLEAVEKCQQNSGDQGIVFSCLNGADICGLGICTFVSLAKLKEEQTVDIYNSVLSARLRRPQLVPNLKEYGYLYRVLDNYLSDFADYANYK